MFDFSNDSHLLSPISQGYVGWAGNVLVSDRNAIPELQFVAKQPEDTTDTPDRKVSLQERDSERLQLTNRPVTAKARLETGESIRNKVRVLIGHRPASGYGNDKVTTGRTVPSPGKPDLTPYKEQFQVLPSYRPQIFPAKTYLTRQGNLMLYAVRDERQSDLPPPPPPELSEQQRFRPVSAVVKRRGTGEQKGVVSSNKPELNKDRPKSAPPAKVATADDAINSEDNSKNRIKTDAELLAELKAEMQAGNSKKPSRPVSARKKRSLSAKKRKKVSASVTPEGHTVPPGTQEEHTMSPETQEGHNGSFEEMAMGPEEVSSGMGVMMVEGRGGSTQPHRVDPRRARMKEQAEKRRLEMEAMRQQMRCQLISATEPEPVISDTELESLLVPDSSSSQLECELSVEELEKKVSTHSLVSSDNSLTDLLANRIAEQKRLEELEAQRAALEAVRREEELAQLQREADLLREQQEARAREERERERREEEERQRRLEGWIQYQEEVKRERYDTLTRAYWRANSSDGISRAYTFSYFQPAKRDAPRLTHAKKERR